MVFCVFWVKRRCRDERGCLCLTLVKEQVGVLLFERLGLGGGIGMEMGLGNFGVGWKYGFGIGLFD